MTKQDQAAERFTEKLLQLIEKASGTKLKFSLIVNMKTGETDTVEKKIARALQQLERDAERRALNRYRESLAWKFGLDITLHDNASYTRREIIKALDETDFELAQSLTTPEAIADEVRDAERRGFGRAIEYLRERAKAAPVGDEQVGRGASTYNWLMHCAELLEIEQLVTERQASRLDEEDKA
jgi:hypothetical protein